MSSARLEQTTDPVTTEIVRHALVAITDEMKTNLMRTAYNPIIYEALDYTVGLFDADGNTVSIGLGLPMFIRGLSDSIKEKIAHFGHEGIKPGDILLTNDAYITGSHLNHIVLTLPIFHEGALLAFASTMAHWQDIGGTLGRTEDIFSEGLQLPIVKLFKEGAQDEEITAIIRANVRLPDLALGDMRAQIAAIRTGERRFSDLLNRYGRRAVMDSIQGVYAQSTASAKSAVARIPDGLYEAESFMDDDGVGRERLPIRVSVAVEGDAMTIDLSGVAPQVRGYFNSGATAGRSAAQVAFKCLTTPQEYPINDGQFRPLRVVLPPGRVVSATKPAAMRKWMTIPMTVVDTVFKALSSAIPQAVAAGHHADLCYSTMHGVDPRSGRFYVSMVNLIGGGWGAKHDEDGVSATICINDGDTHNSPVEATEVKLPVLVEGYRLRDDSGGPGCHRGGLGVQHRVRALAAGTFTVQMERTQCAPWGLQGGLEGRPNAVRVERGDGSTVAPPTGKLESVAVEADDVLVVESGGGGGFGDPRRRPASEVARDVLAGYVSVGAAHEHYGVVVDAEGRIDEAATAELRREQPKTSHTRTA